MLGEERKTMSLTDNLEKNEEMYGTGRMQEYILELLTEIDVFCKKNDIRYSLSAGTLLGAVRHKGFIPWDDDVDIMFDRINYDKFLDLSSNLPKDLVIQQKIWVKRITRIDNPNIDKEMGCVDLFVFDEVPDNVIKRKIKTFLIQLLQGMLKTEHDYSKYTFKEKILVFGTWFIGLPFNYQFKQKLYDRISRIDNTGKNNMINVYNTLFECVQRCRFDRRIIDSYLEVIFEDKKFTIISGYDEYLTEQYGDYMKFPRIEERKPAHMRY